MKMTMHGRFLIVVALFSAPAISISATEVKGRLTPLFKAHCFDCHDSETNKGGLDLTSLAWTSDNADNFQQWTRVFDKVRGGEMPPKKEERISSGELADFTRHLGSALHGASRELQEREGRVVYRRLNRGEYINTISDLFDVQTDLRDLLPKDGIEGGFNTIGAAQNLSVGNLERYLAVAERIVENATTKRLRPETKSFRTDLTEHWLTRPGDSRQLRWSVSPEGFLAIRSFFANGDLALEFWRAEYDSGRYRIRVRARAMLDDGDTHTGYGRAKPGQAGKLLEIGQGGDVQAGRWPIDLPEPRMTLKIGFGNPTYLSAATVVNDRFYEMSPTEFREFEYEARLPRGKTFHLAPYRAIPDTPDREGALCHGLCAVIEWLEIEGPLLEEWPSLGHQLLYGKLPLQPANPKLPDRDLLVVSTAPEADARERIESFLPQLFRRTVTTAEVEEYLAVVTEHLGKGLRFDEALRMAAKMALCSPEFLFFAEKPGRLDDYALANRLSYALWAGPPDQPLRALAASGQLHSPDILLAQTERLLADPKSQRFFAAFLESWLNLRDIDFTQPDTKLYTEFERQLQDGMIQESVSFLSELISHDLSATNIIHSDFAMLNERLAEHYGISGVRGPELRKVALPRGSKRGGFLTQGAILKVSADGTTTSPVLRGAYVLERFLGIHPEPPPKNVPALEPDIRGASTIRQQLEQHRANAACAGCHAKLDPPGFALESYDVTGRWRETYRILPETAKDKVVTISGIHARLFTPGLAVDPAYRLADGRGFADIEMFKELVLSDPEQIARGFTEKLVSHLTGARPQFADREEIETILRRAKASGYGVRTLLREVIQSPLFTRK